MSYSVAKQAMDSFIARQPVFDAELNVFAYELLFRNGPDNFFASIDGDRATHHVMGDSLCVHGLDLLAADRKILVNVTRECLLEHQYAVLPPSQTIVEVLETVEPDDAVVEACRLARSQGYAIALDDYVFETRYDEFIHEFDILKIDFATTTPEERRSFCRFCGPLAALLAEKVETQEQFEEARSLGFSYFQGYFFCQPQVIRTRSLACQSASMFRLLQIVNEPEIDHELLEETIRQDLALSYKLLKYLNSAAFGLRAKVDSVPHAIRLLGEHAIRQWISLIALTTMAEDKPSEIITVGVIRAHLCEAIATMTSQSTDDIDCFSLGLFSVIDALIDRPMNEALDEINLNPMMKATLLGEHTPLSPLLSLVRSIEGGDWPAVSSACERFGLSSDTLFQTYLEAVESTNELLSPALNSDTETDSRMVS